jgi:2-haloacid dehalogenase
MTPITKELVCDQVCGQHYPYEKVLQHSFNRVCRQWGIESDPSAGKRFADGVRSWRPHPDVPEPLKKMGEHYKLVILSNADESFLTEAGYYKPRYGAFEYMLDQLDAVPDDFVHASSHTRYDPLPRHDMGFRNLVLLDRGYDPVPPGYGLVMVKSLDELNTMLGL